MPSSRMSWDPSVQVVEVVGWQGSGATDADSARTAAIVPVATGSPSPQTQPACSKIGESYQSRGPLQTDDALS